ncbi:hypothetical protein L6R29_21085 [Myxococcota bacterium]|nr:hypothetical protein [Myxococcota bacterium]
MRSPAFCEALYHALLPCASDFLSQTTDYTYNGQNVWMLEVLCPCASKTPTALATGSAWKGSQRHALAQDADDTEPSSRVAPPPMAFRG